MIEISLFNDNNKRSKSLVHGPGVQKNHSVIEPHTTWIQFNVLSRTTRISSLK